jgi:dihydroorotase
MDLSNNRRQLLGMAASAALIYASDAFAQRTYDLVIKGGRVIDPAQNVNSEMDVAISGDRIAMVGPSIAPGDARVLNATGKLVVPGLIDIHTHMTQAPEPEGDALVLAEGVTGWIDAGSRGADNIDAAISLARAAPQTAAVLVNIGRGGMGGGHGDALDLKLADVAACRAAIAAHRDVVVGVKARLDPHNAGEHDLENLRRAEAATEPSGLPVMIHIGNTYSPMGPILNLLKRGDIVTHVLCPPPHNVFDDSGRLIPELLAAQERGVIMDVGHGENRHFSWALAEQALKQGFVPNTTSTDWTKRGHDDGTLALPTMMSNLLAIGIPLERVVAMATITAANCFSTFKGRGTLKPGAPADVAVLDLRQGNFELIDSLRVTRQANQKLFSVSTIIGGKILW